MILYFRPLFVACNECPLEDRVCFKDGPNCYLLYCAISDWFNAKKLCQEKGGELAIIASRKGIKKIVDMVKVRQNPCPKFWIGIFSLQKGKGNMFSQLVTTINSILPKGPLWCNADSLLYEDGLFD